MKAQLMKLKTLTTPELAKKLSLILLLLPMACSNEPGSGDGLADSIAGDSVLGNASGATDVQGFELLDKAPAKLLTDTRLQLINYWATWCLPCLEEMPELAAFRNEHNDSVEVYAVNYDRLEIDQLREEIVGLGVEIPALIQDPNELLGYERPSVLPTTVVMLQGQVKEVLVGPQTKESLETVLKKWETKG